MRVHNVAGKGRVGRVQVTGWSHSHQYCQKAGGSPCVEMGQSAQVEAG